MQKQITAEIRVDLSDPERVAAVRQYGLELVKQWQEYAKLVAQGDPLHQQPQVAYYSDDFFTGHEEIDAMEDVLGKAKKEFADVLGEKKAVDESLVDALRDLNGDA